MGAPGRQEGARTSALNQSPSHVPLIIVLQSAWQASEILLRDPDLDHEYLPITGLPEFTSAAARLILGSDSPALAEGRVVSVQTISGTGANHLGALFLSRYYQFDGDKKVYLSDPTWGKSDPFSVSRHANADRMW